MGRRARGGRHAARPSRFRLTLLGLAMAALVAGGVATGHNRPWVAATAAEHHSTEGTSRGAPATEHSVSALPPFASTDGGLAKGDTASRSPVPRRFPDASSTGVPDGVNLRRSGGMTTTEDGTVLENLLIVDGSIDIYANNVVVRNVRITNDRTEVQWGILQREGYSGLLVEDSEIFGNGVHPFVTGIANHGGMATIRRVEIHTITDGVVMSSGVLEDSYLHSPKYFPDDHTDMVQANGGPRGGLALVIRNNTIINTEDQTGAVSLFDNFRPVRNVRVEGNLLAGGGYTFYGGGYQSEGSTPANIVVVDNVFSRRVFPDGGYYGPVIYFDVDAPGNRWSGNVWEDGGTVPPA